MILIKGFVYIRMLVESVVRRLPKAFFLGGCPSLVGKHFLRRKSSFVHMTAESISLPSISIPENTTSKFKATFYGSSRQRFQNSFLRTMIILQFGAFPMPKKTLFYPLISPRNRNFLGFLERRFSMINGNNVLRFYEVGFNWVVVLTVFDHLETVITILPSTEIAKPRCNCAPL